MLEFEFSALIASNATLLYYRMNLLLPAHHILNKKWIRTFLYSFMFCSVPPSLLVWYTMGNSNQTQGRDHFYRVCFLGISFSRSIFQEFGNIPAWSMVNASAVIYEISAENEFFWLVMIYLVIFMVIPCLLVVALFAYCLFLLRNISKTISKKTVQLHSSFLLTIISQVAVEAIVFAVPFLIAVVLILLETQRIGRFFLLRPK